ncbi:hypothetical protein V2J09_006912 [Rumex salicifolius]
MVVQVKTEMFEQNFSSRTAVEARPRSQPPDFGSVIELSSSDEEDGGDDRDDCDSVKRARVSGERTNGGSSSRMEVMMPIEILDPLSDDTPSLLPLPAPPVSSRQQVVLPSFKQFWKAGDYEGAPRDNVWDTRSGGMDHVRVHPKFLHSNATSHKWALGAFAELLDNALDEVCYGATYVNIDMLPNKKDGTPMLLFEDNGGGMDPDKMRQCMSLGYSEKSKLANTIGQYGNGFKTSTMRLGADVIVFSRCPGKDGRSHTQSIGLLSYTFLRSTGKEDIVVPILDYERKDGEWEKIIRSHADDWNRNVETIVQWSPFANEAQLLQQFYMLKDRGTRIFVYNLWEDDQGQLELDFDSDPHDIQIRGVNRDEKSIKMAKEFPNSKHFLTYRHSLRSYVSILYLRLPPNFRIILRGKDVEHHNIVNDMMMTQEVTYRPQGTGEGVPRDTTMVATVTVGFVKDARAHIDVQGFNVYHKNRLIKPFWRVWNAAGSDGRGVIGLLEANFVEPAHDKQGFERTTVLARLETKLVNMQKTYWSTHCHKIGYAPRRNKISVQGESSPENIIDAPSLTKRKAPEPVKYYSHSHYKQGEKASTSQRHVNGKSNGKSGSKPRSIFEEPSSPSANASSEDDVQADVSDKRVNGTSNRVLRSQKSDSDAMVFSPVPLGCRSTGISKENGKNSFYEGAIDLDNCPTSNTQEFEQLKEEIRQLKKRLGSKEDDYVADLIRDLQKEKDKRVSLEKQLHEAELKIEDLNKEQESLIEIFSEERDRRDSEEAKLRMDLTEKSKTINELLAKVKRLESSKF